MSAHSYPRAKSYAERVSRSLFPGTSRVFPDDDFCSSALAIVVLPDEGSPSSITFFEGIALDDETESNIDDQRCCSGLAGRSIAIEGVSLGLNRERATSNEVRLLM